MTTRDNCDNISGTQVIQEIPKCFSAFYLHEYTVDSE